MVAVMNEFEIDVDLTVMSDAVAAIGIVKRQGLGRVRHLAVADLWIQQKAKEGVVHYAKLDGSVNTSDMLTKPVEQEVLGRHMGELGLSMPQGRHPLTPSYTTAYTTTGHDDAMMMCTSLSGGGSRSRRTTINDQHHDNLPKATSHHHEPNCRGSPPT